MTAQHWHEVTYRDELLSDQSVRRAYSDGRFEWRSRRANGQVEWQDSQNNRGVDELLGDGVIKRTFADGRIVYGREQGYGRTAWGDGNLTVNQTSFGGRIGALMAGAGAGFLLGSIVAPPLLLSAEEEAALRTRHRDGDGSGSSTTGGDSGDSDDDSATDDDEAGAFDGSDALVSEGDSLDGEADFG